MIPHYKLLVALTLAALAIGNAESAHAQADLPRGALVRLGTLDFYGGSMVSAMTFTRDSKAILREDALFAVRHWDLATAKELQCVLGDDWGDQPQHFSIFRALDNNLLLHTSANGLALLDLKTGKERVVTELARGKPSWLSPDGKRVLTYTRRGSWAKRTAAATFTLWDLERSEKIRDFNHEFKDVPKKADGAKLVDLAFTPDGTSFVSSWVYLHAAAMGMHRAGQAVSQWDRALDVEAAFNLHFLEGGKVLACGDGRNAGGGRSTNDLYHGTLEIWDVAANKRLHKFESAIDWSGPLAYSPDGKLFASGGGEEENAVTVWSIATGKQVKKFTGQQAKVRFLAFSPDGRLLASASDDTLYYVKGNADPLAESILVWDVQELR